MATTKSKSSTSGGPASVASTSSSADSDAAAHIPLTLEDSSTDDSSDSDGGTTTRAKKSQRKRQKMPAAKPRGRAGNQAERSRLSAKECRARKKLRYQYLEELIAASEEAVFKLREELKVVSVCTTC